MRLFIFHLKLYLQSGNKLISGAYFIEEIHYFAQIRFIINRILFQGKKIKTAPFPHPFQELQG